MRVTQPGGAILVCAEPDYGGRLDYPDLPIGRWQAEALRREGADPLLGRKLRALFRAGRVDVGVIPGLWDLATLRAEFDREWGCGSARWPASCHPTSWLASGPPTGRPSRPESGSCSCRCSMP